MPAYPVCPGQEAAKSVSVYVNLIKLCFMSTITTSNQKQRRQAWWDDVKQDVKSCFLQDDATCPGRDRKSGSEWLGQV